MRQSDLERQGSRNEFMELLAEYDTPAYVQRAQRTERAFQQLLERCQKEREDLLEFPKMRLATVSSLIDGVWERLDEFVLKAAGLRDLHAQWQPKLRVQIAATDSARKIRRALTELMGSFEGFNTKWAGFLGDLDLRELNRIRQDYNDYYVCEKACAFQNEQLAQYGFEALPPISVRTLEERFSLLDLPLLR